MNLLTLATHTSLDIEINTLKRTSNPYNNELEENNNKKIKKENLKGKELERMEDISSTIDQYVQTSNCIIKDISIPSDVQRLCKDPYGFFDEFHAFAKKKKSLEPLPFNSHLLGLSYCSCHPKEIREPLEELVVERMTEQHLKDKEITVVSVGPGAAYQELVYMAKLANAGFSKIRFVFIDRWLKEDYSSANACYDHFKSFCRQEMPGITFKFHTFTHLKNYTSTLKKQKSIFLQPHLLLLIDLGGCKVEEKNLNDYSFSLLSYQNIITRDTVIGFTSRIYTMLIKEWRLNAVSCQYDGNHCLSHIQLHRKEFSISPPL